ncbi:MAG: sugar-binding protein [Paludibacter sp.]
MKKFYVSFILCVITASQIGFAGLLPTSPLVISPNTTVAPVIDGIGNDAAWINIQWNEINQVFHGDIFGTNPTVNSDLDLSAKFKVTFDANKIYFLFDVTDDIIVQDPDQINNGYLGDKIEVYFGLNGFDPLKGAEQALARQFAFTAQNGGTKYFGEIGSHNYGLAKTLIDASTIVTPDMWNQLGVNGKCVIDNPNHYTYEVAIDRAVTLASFVDNSTVYFDVYVADHDVNTVAGWDGDRNRKCWYFHETSDELYNKMTGAGQLTLSGASGIQTVNNEKEYSIHNNILSLKNVGNVNVKVFNSVGKNVLSVINSEQINIESLNPGVYIVNIQNGSKLSIIRFVK